jgi:hypothetical protein
MPTASAAREVPNSRGDSRPRLSGRAQLGNALSRRTAEGGRRYVIRRRVQFASTFIYVTWTLIVFS